MYRSQLILSKLWWGSFRRIFEYFIRKIVRNRLLVISGLLKGFRVEGGMAQVLGIYEIDVQKHLIKTLKKENTFLDIGANNGFFSLLGSKIVGSNGKVFSIEPFINNINSLKKVLRDNAIKNCCVCEIAMSNEVGRKELFFSDNNVTPSLSKNDSLYSTIVYISTIDTIIQKIGTPNVIKVDVEGAESLVLKGSSKLLNSHCKVIWIIEIHDRSNEVECFQILLNAGYKVNKITPAFKKVNEYPFHILAINQ